MIIAKVRVNKKNNQKTLTVPKDAALYKDDWVILKKLEDTTQMNNDKEVQNNGTSTRNDRGFRHDSNPGTSREQ